MDTIGPTPAQNIFGVNMAACTIHQRVNEFITFFSGNISRSIQWNKFTAEVTAIERGEGVAKFYVTFHKTVRDDIGFVAKSRDFKIIAEGEGKAAYMDFLESQYSLAGWVRQRG